MYVLHAFNFLKNNNFLYRKITSTIFVSNGQLKIDGFEHAVKLETNDTIVDVNDEEKYGMFNCPELNKHRKINQKYHIW